MDYTKPHRWFAWHPVLAIDRSSGKPVTRIAFLRFVTRRAVSVGGAALFGYEIA
jgi:hypothetical protein